MRALTAVVLLTLPFREGVRKRINLFRPCNCSFMLTDRWWGTCILFHLCCRNNEPRVRLLLSMIDICLGASVRNRRTLSETARIQPGNVSSFHQQPLLGKDFTLSSQVVGHIPFTGVRYRSWKRLFMQQTVKSYSSMCSIPYNEISRLEIAASHFISCSFREISFRLNVLLCHCFGKATLDGGIWTFQMHALWLWS